MYHKSISNMIYTTLLLFIVSPALSNDMVDKKQKNSVLKDSQTVDLSSLHLKSFSADLKIFDQKVLIQKSRIDFSKVGIKSTVPNQNPSKSLVHIIHFEQRKSWVLRASDRIAFETHDADDSDIPLSGGIMSTAACMGQKRRLADQSSNRISYAGSRSISEITKKSTSSSPTSPVKSLQHWECLSEAGEVLEHHYFNQDLGMVQKVIEVDGLEEKIENIRYKTFSAQHFQPPPEYKILLNTGELSEFEDAL